MITIAAKGPKGKAAASFAGRLRTAVKASSREEARVVRDTLAGLMDADYDARVEPTSRARWAPRKAPTGGWPLLEKTGSMRRTRRLEIGVSRVIMSYRGPADYHQRGTPRMVARRLLPVGSLPPVWQKAIREARAAWWHRKTGL